MTVRITTANYVKTILALEDNRIAMHDKLPYDSVFICDEFAVAIVNMVEEQGLAA